MTMNIQMQPYKQKSVPVCWLNIKFWVELQAVTPVVRGKQPRETHQEVKERLHSKALLPVTSVYLLLMASPTIM